MPDESQTHPPPLSRTNHFGHVKRCLLGLPDSQIEVDCSRVALAFYCIGSLDLLGLLFTKVSDVEREGWREWIWAQYCETSQGSGFRPGPFMSGVDSDEYDTPHLIMTYTALLSLSSLRDDLKKLNRIGVITLLAQCRKRDGSFSTTPQSVESDLRAVYCAFAICSMLDDWSSIDIRASLEYIKSCRTYEGGYGQEPYCEAQGGTTYTALAAIHLIPSPPFALISKKEKAQSIRWLLQNESQEGGFCGRTNKDPDACYCFWCGASLQILGANEYVDRPSLRHFISRCQFKFGGICKSPSERPDPYHTYLSLSALALYPPSENADEHLSEAQQQSWMMPTLDPLLNATLETAAWAREHLKPREPWEIPLRR